jgi:hypothetical protein
MKAGRLTGSFVALFKLVFTFAALVLLFQALFIDSICAQDTVNVPPEVRQAFENAMISVDDLVTEYSYLAQYGEITEMETVDNIVYRTDGPGWDGDRSYASYFMAVDGPSLYQDTIKVTLHFSESYDPDYLAQLGYQPSNILPSAYIKGPGYDPGSYKYGCTIYFYKNEWISGTVEVWLLAPEPAQAEAERLAKLLWSRLPEFLPAPPGQSTPPSDVGQDSSVGSDNGDQVYPPPVTGQPDDTAPPENDYLTGQDSNFHDYIPNAFLPLVAGITTLVTAIGALTVATLQGLTIPDLIAEIKDFFSLEDTPAPPLKPVDSGLSAEAGAVTVIGADPLENHQSLLQEFAEKARRAREQAVSEKKVGFDTIAADLEKKAEQYERIVNEMANYGEDTKIILSEPLPDVGDLVNETSEKLLNSPEINLMGLSEQEWKTLSIEERKARAISTAEMIKESLGLQGELKYAWPADYPYNGAIDLTNYPPTIYIRTTGYHWDDHEALINTIAHEIRHWQQHNPGVSLGNAKIDDAVRRNFKYIFDADKDPALYEESIIERDARNFAEQLVEMIFTKRRR